jgi:DNA primase
VIAFGARILTSDKSQPKYINSPETDIYHKSKVLYGIFQAKNTIRQEDVCYLVEGYTDVISLHQAGIHNVVASSGTSLTEDQIRLIARFTTNVTILYDGDAAGIKAALRGLDMVLEEGLNVSLVTLPDGEDPDSYVYKVGAEGFKAHVKKATTDFITFKTDMLLREAGDNPFKRAEAVTEIVTSITKIPDPIKRQIFFKRTADVLKVDEQTLLSEGNKLLRKFQDQKQKEQDRDRDRAKPAPTPAPKPLEGLDIEGITFSDETDFFLNEETSITAPPTLPPPKQDAPLDLFKARLYAHERAFVRLLILYGRIELEANISVSHYLLHEVEDIKFENPLYSLVLDIFRQRFTFGEIPDTNYFLQHLDPDVQQLTIDFCSNKHHLSENWEKHEIKVPTDEEILHNTAFKAILHFKKAYSADKMKAIEADMKGLNSSSDDDFLALMELMKQHKFYKSINDFAAKELGIVVSGY